jgi:ribose transport system ATP-binding protein
VSDRRYTPRTPSHALGMGIALVAGDRLRQSILSKMPALDNVLLPHFWATARSGVRAKGRERRLFDATAGRLSLKPPDPRPLAWTFSGGNQQKIAVGRWLASGDAVQIFLLDEPTQGIDVGSRAELYALLHELARNEGKAILFTSSDPEETMALADRIIVLRRGRIIAELAAEECDEHRILAIAHGTNEVSAVRPPSVPE